MSDPSDAFTFGVEKWIEPAEALERVMADQISPLNKGLVGLNSTVYRVDDVVAKVSRASGTLDEMCKLRDTLSQEHADNYVHVGRFMPPATQIHVVYPSSEFRGSTKPRVVTVQPFREGISLTQAVKRPEFDPEPTKTFLRLALEMYRQTGKIPDIAAVERMFSFFRTPNIVVDPVTFKPTLVDTTLGKTQRSEKLGTMWNDLISSAAQKALDELEYVGP